MSSPFKIAVIVPVYNSVDILEDICQEILAVFTQNNYEGQLIFVDDGSSDGSWDKIEQLKSAHTSLIKAYKLSKNFGQHQATLCGIKHAQGDLIVTIDDDLEFDPQDIPLLVEKHQTTQAPLIYGVSTKQQRSVFRLFTTFIFKFLAKHISKKGVGSSFRLFTSDLATAIASHEKAFIFIDELFLWYTDNLETVEVTHKHSRRSKSNYSSLSLVRLTSNLILISSSFPLKLVTWLGSLLMISNFILGMFFLIRRLFSSYILEGFTTLVVSILFSTGLILFSLGIIAQYMSKLLLVQFNKPTFYIEKSL